MAQKFPPPPDLGKDNQKLNRWLLSIQAILNSGGLIEPGQIDGLPALISQVNANTLAIAALTANTTNAIGNLTTQQAATQLQLDALQTAFDALAIVYNGTAAPAAGLGNVGDWFADTTGKHIYVKTAAATWTLVL